MHEHVFREMLCELYKERKPGVDVSTFFVQAICFVV